MQLRDSVGPVAWLRSVHPDLSATIAELERSPLSFVRLSDAKLKPDDRFRRRLGEYGQPGERPSIQLGLLEADVLKDLLDASPDGLTLPITELCVDPSMIDEELRLLRCARVGLEKLGSSTEPNLEDLTDDEIHGSEIVATERFRPMMDILDGHIFLTESWTNAQVDPTATGVVDRELVESFIKAAPVIEKKILPSVGRLELYHGSSLENWGTAFVVADEVVLTNNHVVRHHLRGKGESWNIHPGCQPRIDFRSAPEPIDESQEFRIVEVLHTTSAARVKAGLEPDAAFLKVDWLSVDAEPPPALDLHNAEPWEPAGRSVCIVGFPNPSRAKGVKRSRRHNVSDLADPGRPVMKMVQPGRIVSKSSRPSWTEYWHDCSTLKGNSGSPLIDLETCEILGLHYWGQDYWFDSISWNADHNRAVSLGGLSSHPASNRIT